MIFVLQDIKQFYIVNIQHPRYYRCHVFFLLLIQGRNKQLKLVYRLYQIKELVLQGRVTRVFLVGIMFQVSIVLQFHKVGLMTVEYQLQLATVASCFRNLHVLFSIVSRLYKFGRVQETTIKRFLFLLPLTHRMLWIRLLVQRSLICSRCQSPSGGSNRFHFLLSNCEHRQSDDASISEFIFLSLMLKPGNTCLRYSLGPQHCCNDSTPVSVILVADLSISSHCIIGTSGRYPSQFERK